MPNGDRELVIVPAGAGSGKTHKIRETLSDWVERGLVRPERILAVTYTEAAAAELRGRIRSGLLAKGMVEAALAAERGYISTIHGLGLRLLTEHALPVGASPQPRHLDDAERDLLIRQALASSTVLDAMKLDLSRYGYEYNWERKETPEEMLRKQVLTMIDLLRGLGDTGADPKMIEPALARLDAVHGPVIADPVAARDSLARAVTEILAAFPEGGMATVTAADPRKDLKRDLQLFRRLSKNPAVLDHDWAFWQKLRGLFTSNSKSKTPDGYDALAERIMAEAGSIIGHPGPLEDAKYHLRSLISCAQQVMSTYEARKQSLGLIDFADMITGAEKLLRANPSVLDAVLAEIDCVIIDEFQDTSPVQFAFLWQLGQRAPRTLFVGDVKQSIMGFQGADPRLSTALAEANRHSIKPLESNWRSTPDVMQFVNALGQGLFGKDYNKLAPVRPSIDGPALEILKIEHGRAVRKHSKPQEHVAERIARILADGEQVIDRQTRKARTVRPSDIALLVCRHSKASDYAAELRLRGVPVRILEEGWTSSQVVRAACAALSFVANPRDVHSALILRTMGPHAIPLEEALQRQIDGSLLGDTLLQGLSAKSDSLTRLPVSDALGEVVKATGFEHWVSGMHDPEQAEADLLRLEAEAEVFETAHRDLRAASGFYGQNIKVFLGWLEARNGEREFDNRPDPSGNSAEAVEIVTWHASKGREWPITVVAEFDNDIRERPRTTSAQFGSLAKIDDMAAVLASAELIHTPVFAAKETQARFVEARREAFEANARNLLYVALTRARDRIVIEWPAFLKQRNGDPASCLFHVLEDTCHPEFGSDTFVINQIECAAQIITPGAQATVTVYGQEAERRIARFGMKDPLPQVQLLPWRLQPSSIKETSVSVPPSRNISLGELWLVSESGTERGIMLHLAVRAFLTRPELRARLPAATGLDGATLERTELRAKALEEWLKEQDYSELHSEVMVSGRLLAGTELSGAIDLLACGPKGCMIIDYKSGGPGEGIGPYWPQIAAYIDAFPTAFPAQTLKSAAVYWLDKGLISIIDL